MKKQLLFMLAFLGVALFGMTATLFAWSDDQPEMIECAVEVSEPQIVHGKACQPGMVMVGGKSLSPTQILCSQIRVGCPFSGEK